MTQQMGVLFMIKLGIQ